MRGRSGFIGMLAAASLLAGPYAQAGHSHYHASGAGANDGTKRRLHCKCGTCRSCVRAVEAAKAKRERRAKKAQ